MKYCLWIIAFLLCCKANASDTTATIADTSDLHLLYGILKERTPSHTPGEERWKHRSILYRALHINSAAPDSVIAMRMQTGWQELAHIRVSEKTEPPVYFHELLRRALHEHYGVLLLDAVRWGVDLNTMDMNAHKTLMDWLELEYRENPYEERAEWFREYKKILEAGGARYFTELDYRMKQLAKKNDRIRPPVFGMYAVSRNGKWGWVNEKNTVIVPLKYKAVRYTNGKLFEVSIDGHNFYWVKAYGIPWRSNSGE